MFSQNRQFKVEFSSSKPDHFAWKSMSGVPCLYGSCGRFPNALGFSPMLNFTPVVDESTLSRTLQAGLWLLRVGSQKLCDILDQQLAQAAAGRILMLHISSLYDTSVIPDT
jgi:hypothetical protein